MGDSKCLPEWWVFHSEWSLMLGRHKLLFWFLLSAERSLWRASSYYTCLWYNCILFKQTLWMSMVPASWQRFYSPSCVVSLWQACPAMPAWTKDQLSDHRTANRFVVPYPEPASHCFFSMKKGIKVSSRYWVSSRLQYVLNIVLVTIWKFCTWIIWEGFLTSIRVFLACRSMCFYVAFEDEIHKTNCEQFTIQTCRAHDDSSCWVLVLIFIPASFRKYVKGFFYSRGIW